MTIYLVRSGAVGLASSVIAMGCAINCFALFRFSSMLERICVANEQAHHLVCEIIIIDQSTF